MLSPRAVHAKPGAAVLILVLLFGAVALTIGTNLALGSVGELSMGYSDIQSKTALALTDSCADESLLRIRSSLAYAGGTLTYTEGSCIITVTDNAGKKQIDILTTAGRWTDHVILQVDISGSRLALTDWISN